MKKTLIALTFLAGAVVGAQASFFNESFNYPNGGIVSNSAGVWINNTGAAGSCLVSNQTLLINTSWTEDVTHQFSPGFTNSTRTDNLYARLTLQFLTNALPTASGAYFFGFSSTGPSFYLARTWVNTTNVDGVTTAPAGSFYMGVGNNRPASSGAWPIDGQLTTLLTTSVWYTVVVRHCLTNGLATIWVGTDPTTMTENGTTSATAHDTPSATSNIVNYVNFRQSTGEGYLQVKELKVGGSWNDVASPAVPGTLSNLRASQQPGATQVDAYYDLSGAGTPYTIACAISSDGGLTFAVPAAHLSGDGVTSGASPGANRHIVWDAGSDFPGQFSTRMRLKLTLGSSSVLSPMFTLDTRAVAVGALSGVVRSGGAGIANAQVRIDGTVFGATTAGDGTFVLANVPAGSGYLLKVSAAGFASKSLPGVKVVSGTTDLGTIQLTPLGGPYRLLPLQPDVNPLLTQVEDGGVAYRYYQVLAGDGKSGAPNVNVSVRVAGGSTIQQAGDERPDWAGRVAGVSDADGIVRLRIPASALGAPGASASLEALVGGNVSQTFSASVATRSYDQVWKLDWSGVAGASVGLGSVGLGFGHETTIRHEFGQGSAPKEIVGHWREEDYKAEADFGGTLRVNRVGLGAGVQPGGRLTIGLGQSFHFAPQTTDIFENVMKYYAAYADVLNFVPFGGTVIEGVQDQIMANYLSSSVEATQGALRGTGYVQADAGLGGLSPLPGDVALHYWTDGSAEVELELGVENHPGLYVDRYLEFGVGWALGVQSKLSPQAAATAMFQDSSSSLRGSVRRTANDSGPSELVVGSTVEMASDTARPVGGWLTGDLVQLRDQEKAEYKSECTLGLSGAWALQQVPLNAWQSINNMGQGASVRSSDAALLLSSLLSAGQTVAYQKTAYSGKATVGSFLPNFDVVLSLDASAQEEAGAEIKREAGVIWQNRLFGLEAYTDDPHSFYPTATLSDLQATWMSNGRAWFDQELHKGVATVVSGADTLVQMGKGAVLRIRQGAMNVGSQIITDWRSLTGSGSGSYSPKDKTGDGPRPKDQQSLNLSYGIGGIYHFESTNSLNGTATLTISYSASDVSGLNAADLRMYYLPDGTNRWQLVGGTVSAASNTVSAVVSNLGTYAVAPPLPTGDLQLVASTNSLPADGVSHMTIVVTNLMLNTGNTATQQWVLTARAVGINILNPDLDPSTPGVQVMSTNGTVTLLLGAPQGGYTAQVGLSSVVGDAVGSTAINLTDNTPPGSPSGVKATAGQSRIWVSWRTNSEPDLAGYRVYYRAGAAGPLWDGTSTVEGSPSPVQVSGTNVLLRGLVLGTNYFVAVSAVDTTGNESPLSAPVLVTMTPGAPAGPTGVAASFGSDGTNILMWALSEDDGYNDRDVVGYDVFRAVLPGGLYAKVSEVSAGVGLYCGSNLAVSPTQYVGYAVVAVASNGLSSAQAPATRYMADGRTVDTDGDGISDSWMLAYFGHPTGQASDQSFAWNDPAGDGLSNLQKYLLGRNPLVWDNLHFVGCGYLADGRLRLTVFAQAGHNYTLLAATNLMSWTPVLTFACTNGTMDVFDPYAKAYAARFYRLAPPVGIAGPRLGLGSAHPLSSNGLDLALFSVPGLQYRVDASGDLLNWTAVTSFISTNAVMYFRDASATNYSKRFYRAVLP